MYPAPVMRLIQYSSYIQNGNTPIAANRANVRGRNTLVEINQNSGTQLTNTSGHRSNGGNASTIPIEYTAPAMNVAHRGCRAVTDGESDFRGVSTPR